MSLNTLSGLSMLAGLSPIDDPGLYESNLFSLKRVYVMEKSKAGYHVCSMCLQHFPDKSTLDRHNRTFFLVSLTFITLTHRIHFSCRYLSRQDG